MNIHEQLTPEQVLSIIKTGGDPPIDPHNYADAQLWLLVKQYVKAKGEMLNATKDILKKIRL